MTAQQKTKSGKICFFFVFSGFFFLRIVSHLCKFYSREYFYEGQTFEQGAYSMFNVHRWRKFISFVFNSNMKIVSRSKIKIIIEKDEKNAMKMSHRELSSVMHGVLCSWKSVFVSTASARVSMKMTQIMIITSLEHHFIKPLWKFLTLNSFIASIFTVQFTIISSSSSSTPSSSMSLFNAFDFPNDSVDASCQTMQFIISAILAKWWEENVALDLCDNRQ